MDSDDISRILHRIRVIDLWNDMQTSKTVNWGTVIGQE